MSEGDCTAPGDLVTEAEVEAWYGHLLQDGPPARWVVELEWIVHEPRPTPWAPLPPERLDAAYVALRALPLSSALTSGTADSWS
ncbi:hypothetical protein [Streptomyces sp. KL116D]|uniref:hypothetical protein n=1 Tax=Streptomyces sp. KL116D TaxID=3045152 RepID=UPI00355820AE